MKMKKIVALGLSTLLSVGFLAGCGSKSDDVASVYYLNFKPEVADQWQAIAEEYTAETGIPVKVDTAASGTYESTLKSEMAKREAPTLFQINGPIGYQSWKDYCLDLTDTSIYDILTDKEMAVKDDTGVYGIPYVVEGYGIIYNDEIMQKYFALPEKAVDIDKTEDITDFDTLKLVVEDMTVNKDAIGIEGVFSSTSFSAGEDWRWQTHLANIPVYYEYKDNNVSDMPEIEFKYNENFKNTFDLYLNNSITDKGLIGSKTVEDSMAEFALGKTAMVQNGNWGYGQISEVQGNVVSPENVKFLPIYTGMSEDNSQGLCIGTENFFSINSKASEAEQQASIDFVNWVFTSEKGKELVTNELGFIAPFNTFTEAEQPTDPLAQEIVKYMNDSSKTSVTWSFTTFPGQNFKDQFGASLLEYANGNKEWDKVVTDMVDSWKTEKAQS